MSKNFLVKVKPKITLNMDNKHTDDENEIMAKNYSKLLGATTKVNNFYLNFYKQFIDRFAQFAAHTTTSKHISF